MKKLLSILLVLALALPLPALAQPSTNWAAQHAPAAATQATIGVAAVPSMRHVATSITVCVASVAAQAPLVFNLRDGASGAGTILWTVRISTLAGMTQCVSANVMIVGSANTAMTLESAAAPAATNFATVSLNGHDAYF